MILIFRVCIILSRLIPGLFPLYWFRVLSKYLQTQNILAPSVFIDLFAVGKQALFSWTLMFKSGWGIAGAPWATNLTVTTEFLMMILFMLWKKKTLLKDTWPTVSCEHLSVGALKPFLHIAVQGALAKFGVGECNRRQMSQCLQQALEHIPSRTTSANLSFYRSLWLTFAIYMSLLLIFAIESVIVAALLIWKIEIGQLFSSDDEVTIIVSNILPMACFFLFTDAIVGVASATFYAIGRLKWKLYISLVEYLLFGLPLSYYLAFQTNLETRRMNKRSSSLGMEDEHAVAGYLDDIATSTEPLLSNKHGVEGQAGEMDVVFV
ncbi:hypothetical protein ACHAXN_009692 [Cyclotella atomus]